MKVRFLFDYQEHEIGIDPEMRAVVPDELVDGGVPGRPAMLLRVGSGYRFGLFLLDARNAFAVEKNRQHATLVPRAVRHFPDFINTQLRAVVEVDPRRGGDWRGF